jgi:hypothetical protein
MIVSGLPKNVKPFFGALLPQVESSFRVPSMIGPVPANDSRSLQ